MVEGVIVPNITIFEKDGTINFDKMKEHMLWMVERGVDGFFVTGSYGSGPLLTFEEKIKVYETAMKVKEVHKNVKIIANISCVDTSTAKVLVKEVKDIGVENIASTVPYYYNFSNKEISIYFSEIVDEFNGNTFIYNNPVATGYRLSEEMLLELKKVGVCGVKDSALDMKLIGLIMGGRKELKDFQYIAGTSLAWPIMQKIGVKAMIAGICNYMPEIITNLYKSNGNAEECHKYYSLMMDLRRSFGGINSVALSVAGIKARGFDSVFTRKPIQMIEEKSDQYLFIKNKITGILNQYF